MARYLLDKRVYVPLNGKRFVILKGTCKAGAGWKGYLMGEKIKINRQEKKNKGIIPVCIAGMHRSGTSMVAQLLHNCGLYLGNKEDILGPAPDNQDGFWENVRFVHLNDEILRRLGGAWDFPPILRPGWERGKEITHLIEPAAELVNTFSRHETWGWKDPRNSLTAPFWEEVIGQGNIKYVICLRNPLEVARSIYKRNFNSFAFSFNLWHVYQKTIINQTPSDRHIITHYESYFKDPEQELKRILSFLEIEASDDLVAKACSKIARNLRHYSLSKEDLVKAGASRDLIQFYDEMCSQAGPVFLSPVITEVTIPVMGSTSSLQATSAPASFFERFQERTKPIQKGMVSIVILTFNQLEYTRECLESIKQYTPEPHEIIFVDNGSTDGTVEWLREIISKHSNCRLIENGSNFGFARGCNQGIEAATGDYILLLNNDVVVTENWLSGLLDCLQSEPNIGIVGPVTNNLSGIQQDPEAVYKTMGDMHAYARTFWMKNRHRRIPLRRIVGFCMLFRRSLVESIGLLDENFGTGNFEDDDYCLRAALEGYRNFVAGDVFIHHYGSRSFIGNKIDYAATLGGHRKIFSEKWSNIKRDSELGEKLLVLSKIENAESLGFKGEVDQAVAVCIEGIGEFPEQALMYQTLAWILLEAKRYHEAFEAIEAMPEDNKKDERSLLLSGYCKEGLDLNEEAEIFADRVLALSPGQVAATNLKGKLAFKRGDIKQAEIWFSKAINQDPGYGESYTNQGVIKWAEGIKEEGLSLLEKGFILSPMVMDVSTLYHSAIIELGEFERAEKIFQEAKAFYPQNQRIAFLLIDLFLRQGKEKPAMQEIERVMAAFELSDGLLQAALAVRDKIGPNTIKKGNQKSLSVSMIVKNEEKHIGKCLMSVKPIAEEMIVIDTGSTDRTKDIARALGAKVFVVEWNGDFSEARNYCLSKAKGGWILSLDADEVISPKDYRAIREIVERNKPSAYEIITRNYSTEVGAQGFTFNIGEYPMEESGLGWFPSAKVRLFPNHKGIRFENPVHEFVERSVSKAGIPIVASSIPVHHYGRLDNIKLKEKGEAYYQLGKKKLAEKGDRDLKALFELGVQAGELKKYNEAAEFFERLVQFDPLYPLAQFNLGFAYLELNRFTEAWPYAKKGYELNPERKEGVINLANCEIVVGDVSYAVALLSETLQKVPGYPPAMALLAVAYALTGNPDCYQILEELKAKKFDCRDYLHGMAEALTNAGRFEQAVLVFDLIVKTHNIRENTKEMLEQCYQASLVQPSPHNMDKLY
jgi:GT2 family glycosyltransferase/Flp pilus assembly protein TadD